MAPRSVTQLLPGHTAVVIGAGPAGLTAAYLLSKKGVKVTVKGRNGAYGPVTGPLTVEIGLGGPAEQMGGQCGEQALTCTVSGTKAKCVAP